MTMAILLLFLILLHISTIESTNSDLLNALQASAGVYLDQNKVNQYALHHTVLVTGCNYGFINHLFNFKCFTDRLGMKFLTIAMDADAHGYLTNSSLISYLMDTGITGSAEFRDKQFNLITARKKEAVRAILAMGYDVLFSDTDVSLIRDPFPYLLYRGMDYVHSLNDWCRVGDKFELFRSKIEGNTGFYYVRSSNESIKLWADAYAAAPRFPRLDDQAIFWKILRSSKDPPILPYTSCQHLSDVPRTKDGKRYLTTCYLDTCVFSSGMLSRKYVPELTYEMLLSNLDKLNDTMVSVHANYISGNKKKMLRMAEHGMWLLDGFDVDGAKGYKCKEYKFVGPAATAGGGGAVVVVK